MKSCNEELMRELAHVFLLMRRRMDRVMSMNGASLARTKLLLCVEGGEGRARAADLADLLGQAPRTVTEGLDALERDGLLLRTPDPVDRRVKRLTITDAGRTAIAATEPLRRSIIDEVFGVLDADERAALHAALAKLAAQLPIE